MSVPAAPLHSARIARSWDETPSLRGVALELERAHDHTAPGQYLKVMAAPGVEGFFAMSSAPGREPKELLVKRGAPVADALAALAPGETIRVSAPMGKGYPVADHAGHDLVLFAAGSGIAPIRSVVQHVIADRGRFGRVRLFYGQRRTGEFAYGSEAAAWRDAGVEVVHTVSGADDPWLGARGHVQDVFRANPGALERAMFYVCGMKVMVSQLGETLAALGVDRGRMFLNY